MLNSTWAIAEREMPRVEALIRRSYDQPELDRQAAAGRTRPSVGRRGQGGDIAVIPITGVIDMHESWYSDTSTLVVGEMLDAVMEMPSVSTIILAVDSPGGTSAGVEELADKIFNARARGGKQIIGHAGSMAASAAYWLISQCEKVVATPSADVGSIGVYAGHIDMSRALDKQGITVTLVKAGKYKAELNPYQPLAADAKDHLQASVDRTYRTFVNAVARGRKVSPSKVEASFGQGTVFNAREALTRSMIDAVMPFDALINRLLANKANMDMRRAEHKLRKAETELSQAQRWGAHHTRIMDVEEFVDDCEQSLVKARREFSQHYLHDPSVSAAVRERRKQHEKAKRETLHLLRGDGK